MKVSLNIGERHVSKNFLTFDVHGNFTAPENNYDVQ